MIKYHGLETAPSLYPAATDLINKMGAYDALGNANFTRGTTGDGLTNLTDAKFLEDNIDRAFTAYLKLNVTHECYDPLISKQYFNVRYHRPINVAAKEYIWDDRVLNDNKLAIKDLIEVVDWNRFPVVAYNSGAVSSRNVLFDDIDNGYPKYADVYASGNKVKQQNLGLPFEYYGIAELAVRYDEIRTDHAKEVSVRKTVYRDAKDIIANTHLVKELNSLTSPREYNFKTVTLLNADETPVSFTQPHAYNHSNFDPATGNTIYGWLYYNNDASDTQLFHIYVPIAVKYNWGNIAWDYQLDPAGVKLDKDYTQVVWAIITVNGTH